MSCYLLPKGILAKLRGAISKFWWNSRQNNRGISWVAWDKICTPFSQGGLGFRDLESFNLALLAKQMWRLIHYPNSLLARVLKGRYYRTSNPLEARMGSSPSRGWRSIMAAKPLLLSGIRRTVNSGNQIRVWKDPWIPNLPSRETFAHISGGAPDPILTVDQLIDGDSRKWNIQRLEYFFPPDVVAKILAIKIGPRHRRDGFVWSFTPSGSYSVKSGYEQARELLSARLPTPLLEPSSGALKEFAWKIDGPRKLKHFLWQILTGSLATCQRLTSRHLGINEVCPRCGDAEETVNHLLFECPPALQVWALSNIPSAPGIFPRSSLLYNIDYLFWRIKEFRDPETTVESFPWILWYIWKARNDKLFNGRQIHPHITLKIADAEARVWEKSKESDPILEEDVIQNAQDVAISSDIIVDNVAFCRSDASWIGEKEQMGLGWFFREPDGSSLFGLRSALPQDTALHAEMEALL